MRAGALLGALLALGPACRAGVRTGDFILALNGQAVQYVGDLHRGFAESPFGEPVRLGLLRRTRRMVLEVTPEETQRREN